MRSANEIGPPLEYVSIPFFASIMRSKAAESPLFSGLPSSTLQEIKKKGKEIEMVRISDVRITYGY